MTLTEEQRLTTKPVKKLYLLPECGVKATYGMLHDPKLWEAPIEFHPERFKNWDGNPFTLIPQGGGEHLHGHRCAGEWLTMESMKQAVDFLVNRITYKVPDQNLKFSLSRMPTLPKRGFIINNIKKNPYK